MEINELLQAISVWAQGLFPYAIALVTVVILDLIGGVALALKTKTFDLSKVGDFAATALLRILGWFMAEVLAFLPTALSLDIPGYAETVANGFGLLTFAGVFLMYVGSILGHITAFKELPGVRKIGVKPTEMG